MIARAKCPKVAGPLWMIEHYASSSEIVAIIGEDCEELAAAKCPDWDAAMAIVQPAAVLDRREAMGLSVLLWALAWDGRDVAGTVERWRALSPTEAYWLGRKAESGPTKHAWRAAIGIAIGEEPRHVG